MFNAEEFYDLFYQSVTVWHEKNGDCPNPYPVDSLEYMLFEKNQIDSRQWHFEDDIRREDIEDSEIRILKGKIDAHNQQRTDLVEKIDDYFFAFFSGKARPDALLNTETPAWAVDRLSILSLKIFHMDEETRRQSADDEHRRRCGEKLAVLLEQRGDLTASINQYFSELEAGTRRIKLYRQMKMYNDPATNPALYENKK